MKEENTYGSDEIAEALNRSLEIWPFENSNTRIHIEHPEYTALCPRSGYPDFGKIVLDYVPDKLVVELKAWKLYINAFRELRISHENVVNQIADKFFKEVKPVSLRIIGDFTRRGGVKTVVEATRFRDEDAKANTRFYEYKAEIL